MGGGLHNQVFPPRFPYGVPSVAPSASLEQIWQTLYAGSNPQLEWYELSLCLFPLLQHFPVYDDPPALFHAPDPSPHYFSLWKASLSGDHYQQMHGLL